MLAERCRRVSLDIYGRSERTRLTGCVAWVPKAPGKPLRVVAVESLPGGRNPQAFYSTSHEAIAEQVIAWYESCWTIEVAFHDSKQLLGFEQPQNWPCCCIRSSCGGSRGKAIVFTG